MTTHLTLILGLVLLLSACRSAECTEGLASIRGECIEPRVDGTGGAGGMDGTGGAGGMAAAKAIDPEPVAKPVSVICTNSVLQDTWSSLPWELTVDPAPIEGRSQFSVNFDGVVLFPESFLDISQAVIEGGVREINLLDLQATVLVHAGATGAPTVLTVDAIPYQCALEDPPGTRPTCDPANDLPGGPSPVGNTGCQPQGPSNPCARFVSIPTSDDCTPGGTCWDVGREEAGSLCDDVDFCKEAAKTQCATNGYCVTGDLRLPMKSEVQKYIADPDGEVLFGWHESNRGLEWQLVQSVFQESVGPIGLRLYLGTLPVAFECVLGRDQGGNVVGPTPDTELISFPILEHACTDGTKVCPEGFTSANGGECRFSAQSVLTTLEDPFGSAAVCAGLPSLESLGSVLPIGDASVLGSPSLAVRATIEARNVDDDACLASVDPIVNIFFWDEEQMNLANTLLVFNQPTEVSVSQTNPSLRSTAVLPFGNAVWSSGPDVCCERTFQTLWEVSVGQCEGW